MKIFIVLVLVAITLAKARIIIVGGRDADITEVPWTVSLQLRQENKPPYHFCGGSIISSKHVLTAAHCFDYLKLNPANFVIRSGSSYKSSGGILNDVVKINRHPHYSRRRTNFDYAVLSVSEEFDVSDGTTEIIEMARSDPPEHAMAIVDGWGNLEENGTESEQLQLINVPINRRQDCVSMYPLFITRNNFCAGYVVPSKDACQGDSGGPLVIKSGMNNKPILYGIVSSGRGCARRGAVGIYASVSAQISWIEQIITSLN